MVNNQMKIVLMQLLGCLFFVCSASAMTKSARAVLLPTIAEAVTKIKIPKEKPWFYEDLVVENYDNSKPATKVGQALSHQALMQALNATKWHTAEPASEKEKKWTLAQRGAIAIGRPFVVLEEHSAVDNPRKDVETFYYREANIAGQDYGVIPDCLPVEITTKGCRMWGLFRTRKFGQSVDTIRYQLYLLCGPAYDFSDVSLHDFKLDDEQ